MSTQIQKAVEKRILATLADLGGKLTTEDDIEFGGQKFMLPDRYQHDLRGAVTALQRKVLEAEQETVFSKVFRCRPWDGAYNAYRAMQKAFGMVTTETVPGGFFTPDEPPQMISIPIGPGQTVDVPWGRMRLPVMPDVTIDFDDTHDAEWGPLFSVVARGPRKWRSHMAGLFRLVQEEINAHSIYRGRAFDGKAMPDFLDLSGVRADQVFYAEAVKTQLAANLWVPITERRLMKRLGSPLKRAVLLEGTYGTGKTLAMLLTAQLAESNGWSFLLCRPGRDDLLTALQTARLYQPCVVAFEDLDTVGAGDAEDHKHISTLLDIFDGIGAKGTEIIAVLTTNRADRIHKGMIRPGRIDAVISFGGLDAGSIRDLAYAKLPPASVDPAIDWSTVEVAMDGFVPAFVSEAIDRTIRYAVARVGSAAFTVTTADLVAAADGLRPQLALMQGAGDGGTAPAMDAALRAHVEDVVNRSRLLQHGNESGYTLKVKEPKLLGNGATR